MARGFNWTTGKVADGISELVGNGPISDQAKQDAAANMPATLEAAQRARHHASNAISKTLGFGEIDPSIYRNDAASRISGEAADFAPYFIPGVGEALGGVQMGLQIPQLSQAIEQNGVRATASGVWDSLNPAAPGLHPDERVMRGLNLGLMGKGAIEGAGKAVGAIRGAVRVSPQMSQVLERVAGRHLSSQGYDGAGQIAGKAANADLGAHDLESGGSPTADASNGIPALFTTESGHVYDLHAGGLTNRYVHDGDRYHQLPRSSSTFYLAPQDAVVLSGRAQALGKSVATFLDSETGSLKAGVKHLDGPLAGQFDPASIVDAISEPSRGFIPVETFGQGASPAFGDRIAGIDYMGPNSGSPLEGETYGPNLEFAQYRLEAKKLGMYPVMTRGFREPTDWVRLDVGDHWKYGQTKRGELRYDPRFLDDLNLKFVGETYHDARLGARRAEFIRILHQRSGNGGELLPGNKIHA